MKLRSSKKYFRPEVNKTSNKAKGRVKRIKKYDKNINIKNVDTVIMGDATIIIICNMQNINGANEGDERMVYNDHNILSLNLMNLLNEFHEKRLLEDSTDSSSGEELLSTIDNTISMSQMYVPSSPGPTYLMVTQVKPSRDEWMSLRSAAAGPLVQACVVVMSSHVNKRLFWCDRNSMMLFKSRGHKLRPTKFNRPTSICCWKNQNV